MWDTQREFIVKLRWKVTMGKGEETKGENG
jgi:hypothetical protein